LLACLAWLGAGTPALHAGTDTWSGGGANNNWSTAGNWSSASAHEPPISGDSLIFTGTTRLTANNNLSSFTYAGLTFSSTAGAFTLTGNSLTLTGSLIDNSSNPETVNLSLTLTTSQIIMVAGGGSLLMGGVLSGTGGITLNGLGSLTLDGHNTYTGTTLVSGGTLVGSGSLNGPVVVGPAGNLGAGDAGGIGVLTLLATPLTLSGNATLRLSKTGGVAVSDNITGISTATYGGTLTISNITTDGTPLVVGDTFTLFTASTGTSNFTSIVGSPGTGLAYYFDPTNGVLGVAPAIGGGGPATDSYLAVNTLDGSTIGVYFDQPVDPVSATQLTNYLVYGKGVRGSINVTNVVLQSDVQSVALALDSPVGQFYAVAVSNVFNSLGDTIIDAAATGYPGDFTTTNLGTLTDPSPVGTVFAALTHAFTVTASGSGIGDTNDHCQFVYQPVIGDFDISVQVTSLDGSNPSALAGLLARNSLDPGSPMALLNLTPVSGSDEIQTSGRSTTNGTASLFTATGGADSFPWLRLNRTGKILTAYYGTNGVDWVAISNAFPLVLNPNLYVGVALSSGTNGRTTTASFANFGVSGAQPADAIIPSVSARIFQTNNVVVSWPVTPEDYAVVLATNLTFSTNTTSGGTSSTNAPMGWVLVGLPIQDSNLTGTNAAMPGLGRYQILPLNIFGNTPMFLRLEKVAKVIPDPLNVTSGMILSEAKTNLSPDTSASKLCSISVISTNAVLLVSSNALLCFAGTNYTFTTAPNAPSPVVALQVTAATTNSISIICGTNIAAANANVAEYQVTLKPAKTPTLCTFVAAPTTPVNHNSPIQVQVFYH
jgi:autotransporter-associated beta strand protein